MQTEKKVAAAGKLRRFFIFCTLGGTLHKKRKRKKEERRGEERGATCGVVTAAAGQGTSRGAFVAEGV